MGSGSKSRYTFERVEFSDGQRHLAVELSRQSQKSKSGQSRQKQIESRKSIGSSERSESSQSSSDEDEEDVEEFLESMRKRIKKFDGAEIREIILSLCLKYRTLHKDTLTYVKGVKTVDKKAIEYSSEGLVIHLQYFDIGALKKLLCHMCENGSSEARNTVDHLIETMRDQAKVDRSKRLK
ncbi:hypothetical protein F5Y05DRAFT_413812 [Hypoxylon sp. FL0543]|nr:hypothetical protein F5Y05DRAFT_413812 [Hypoxylon sp. FL0543]